VVAVVLTGNELRRARGRALGDRDRVVGRRASDEVVLARRKIDEREVGVREAAERLEALASPEGDTGRVSRGEVGALGRPGKEVVTPPGVLVGDLLRLALPAVPVDRGRRALKRQVLIPALGVGQPLLEVSLGK
jgi:hypothetical protein